MRGSRKIFQRGSNSDNIYKGREDPNVTINGSPSAADDGPTLNADFSGDLDQTF